MQGYSVVVTPPAGRPERTILAGGAVLDLHSNRIVQIRVGCLARVLTCVLCDPYRRSLTGAEFGCDRAPDMSTQ